MVKHSTNQLCNDNNVERSIERGAMYFFLVIYVCSNFGLGVAYSKHIVHIYFYQGGNDFKNHLEVCLNFYKPVTVKFRDLVFI